MQVIAIKTELFREKDSLEEFIKKNISSLDEGSVIAVTSKVVALSEGRIGKVEDKEKIIVKESKRVIKTPWAYLTLSKDGWGINAGIDESNAENKLVLLPKDSFKTADMLLKKLKRHYSVKNLGILITDTRSVPLRVGTLGRALGYAGFEPLKSYIGKKDLFGRKSRITQSNIVDALAVASVMIMGEGNEQIPMVIIKNAPVVFTLKSISEKQKQLAFPPEKDIFLKAFTSVEQKSHKFPKKK